MGVAKKQRTFKFSSIQYLKTNILIIDFETYSYVELVEQDGSQSQTNIYL